MKKIYITLMFIALFGLAAEVHAADTSYQYTRLLKTGSRGNDVVLLQSCLNRLGYNTGIVDGWFGKNTARGVREFQAAQGLVVDAIIGKNTGPRFTQACLAKDESVIVPVIEDAIEESSKLEEEVVGDVSKKESRVVVDGYHAFGDDAAAKVNFTLDIENDGDDITLAGLEAFVFEIDGVEYDGVALDALAGYTLDIEADDEDVLSGVPVIVEDGRDLDIEIKIIVDAGETVKGTGEYEINFDRIDWSSAVIANGKLHLNAKSDEVDLLA